MAVLALCVITSAVLFNYLYKISVEWDTGSISGIDRKYRYAVPDSIYRRTE